MHTPRRRIATSRAQRVPPRRGGGVRAWRQRGELTPSPVIRRCGRANDGSRRQNAPGRLAFRVFFQRAAQWFARWAHNPQASGSGPLPDMPPRRARAWPYTRKCKASATQAAPIPRTRATHARCVRMRCNHLATRSNERRPNSAACAPVGPIIGTAVRAPCMVQVGVDCGGLAGAWWRCAAVVIRVGVIISSPPSSVGRARGP